MDTHYTPSDISRHFLVLVVFGTSIELQRNRASDCQHSRTPRTPTIAVAVAVAVALAVALALAVTIFTAPHVKVSTKRRNGHFRLG